MIGKNLKKIKKSRKFSKACAVHYNCSQHVSVSVRYSSSPPVMSMPNGPFKKTLSAAACSPAAGCDRTGVIVQSKLHWQCVAWRYKFYSCVYLASRFPSLIVPF